MCKGIKTISAIIGYKVTVIDIVILLVRVYDRLLTIRRHHPNLNDSSTSDVLEMELILVLKRRLRLSQNIIMLDLSFFGHT